MQDIAFINPANVVFVYLLVRDCVDHNIVKETELQVRRTFLVSVTLRQLWILHEIVVILKITKCFKIFSPLLCLGCGPGMPLSLVQLHGERDQLPPQAFPRWDGQGEVLGSLCHHYKQAKVGKYSNIKMYLLVFVVWWVRSLGQLQCYSQRQINGLRIIQKSSFTNSWILWKSPYLLQLQLVRKHIQWTVANSFSFVDKTFFFPNLESLRIRQARKEGNVFTWEYIFLFDQKLTT